MYFYSLILMSCQEVQTAALFGCKCYFFLNVIFFLKKCKAVWYFLQMLIKVSFPHLESCGTLFDVWDVHFYNEPVRIK